MSKKVESDTIRHGIKNKNPKKSETNEPGNCANSKRANKNDPSVIIIGAGVAGIAAAAKLFQNGFENVKILEAENRIGGRVYTTTFGNHQLELGAHWIVGDQGNVICELASQFELYGEGCGMTEDTDEKIFDSSGNLITLDQSEIEQLGEIYDHEGDFEQFAENNKNASVGDCYNKKIEEFVESHPKWKTKKQGLTHLLDMIIMAQYGADSWNDSSVQGYLNYEKCPGTFVFHWKERGFHSILDIIMKRYPNPEEEIPVLKNTVLNTQVSCIDYSNTNGKVVVKTAKGETYTADHVIVTCSLGVLKDKHKSLFKPALPERKQRAIEEMDFGNIVKLYLYYDQPWWPSENTGIGFSFLWLDQDLQMFRKDDETNWLQGLVGFYTFTNKPKLLCAFVMGEHSRNLEKLTDDQVTKHCIQALRRFLGRTYEITYPTAIIRSMWYTNENFQGTYCFLRMNRDHEIGNPAVLAEPIGDEKPIILFAGEATSLNHSTTVHGAIETGWREADRIINN